MKMSKKIRSMTYRKAAVVTGAFLLSTAAAVGVAAASTGSATPAAPKAAVDAGSGTDERIELVEVPGADLPADVPLSTPVPLEGVEVEPVGGTTVDGTTTEAGK